MPKKNIKLYKKMSATQAKVWIKYGALEYVDTIADDVPKGKITSFPKSVKLKSNEIVACTYMVYKSKQERDRIMEKLHYDPVINKGWDNMPFDGMRMIFGGYKQIVNKKK